MRITHCLLSCDSNPEYLDFWPVVAKAWLKLGIKPVLFYIATDKNRHPEEVPDCPVHTFESIADIPMKIQASTLRYWGCRYYPDDIVIVSDIDLIPLSRKFFIDYLHDTDENAYVHMLPVSLVRPTMEEIYESSNNCLNICVEDIIREHAMDKADYFNANYLNACYHVGRGNIMDEVWGFSNSWQESCRKTVPYWYMRKRPSGWPAHPHYGDEIYPTVRVAAMQARGDILIKLPSYSYDKFNWLCTLSSPATSEHTNFRSGYYSALHAPRPYTKHRAAIEQLLALNDSLHLSSQTDAVK